MAGQEPADTARTVGVLQSVAAVSARNAWAVGRAGAEGCACGKTLILHWDGVPWSRVPSPSPTGGVGSLSGVAFTKARDGWAVGTVGDRPLILRWSGAQWRQVASPTPPGGRRLKRRRRGLRDQRLGRRPVFSTSICRKAEEPSRKPTASSRVSNSASRI